MKKTNPTQEQLKTALHYNPATGEFTWKQHKIKTLIGTKAGTTTPHGMIYIGMQGARYHAACLAILYITGILPKHAGYHDKKQSNIKYDNLFPSQKIIRYKKQQLKTNKAPDKNAIINAMDGEQNFNKGHIAKKLGIDNSGQIRHQIDELSDGGFIKQSTSNSYQYNLTAKGHQAIMNKTDLEKNQHLNLLKLFYQKCCPGNGPEIAHY